MTEISLKNDNSIEVSSQANLAESEETNYDPSTKKTKTWTLP